MTWITELILRYFYGTISTNFRFCGLNSLKNLELRIKILSSQPSICFRLVEVFFSSQPPKPFGEFRSVHSQSEVITMAEKVTIMVLKVDDLQCPHCRKKIKKILSKFPQTRDQTYDEKQNTVTIKVVCCSPEKLRDKLCCKGGKTIKSITILPPPKPKPPEKPAVKPQEAPKPDPPKKLEPAPKALPPPEPVKLPEPVRAYPIGICCGPCYEGQLGGPCYHGYGVPPPPPPGPYYDSYGGYGRGYDMNRGDCFSEENPSACTIM